MGGRVKEDGDIVTYYRKGLPSLELLVMPAGHHARLSDISTGFATSDNAIATVPRTQ